MLSNIFVSEAQSLMFHDFWDTSYVPHKWKTNKIHCGSISTIIALLALHIETALDPTETDLVHSMARISISQTMLVLTEGKEIPALKRALPLFEDIISKKRLFLVSNTVCDAPTQLQSEGDSFTDMYALPHTHVGTSLSQIEQWGDDQMLYGDYLEFEFLDQWQIGQLDFTRQS